MMMVLCGSWLWQQCSGVSVSSRRQCVALLLPKMVEGGGCAVMVDAGVVGVVAAVPGKKKREKNYHNTVQFIILSYIISN